MIKLEETWHSCRVLNLWKWVGSSDLAVKLVEIGILVVWLLNWCKHGCILVVCHLNWWKQRNSGGLAVKLVEIEEF